VFLGIFADKSGWAKIGKCLLFRTQGYFISELAGLFAEKHRGRMYYTRLSQKTYHLCSASFGFLTLRNALGKQKEAKTSYKTS